MGFKKLISLARFMRASTVENAQRVLDQPGSLRAAFSLRLLTLMSKRTQPGLLFWPEALSQALPRCSFTPRQGRSAANLFFSWLNDNGITVPSTRVESLERQYNTPEDSFSLVGGRRRLWALAIRLSRELAAAGASPSAEDFNRGKSEYGAEICMAVFEHACSPESLARRLEQEWKERGTRQWAQALSALPNDWLADIAERLDQSHGVTTQAPILPGMFKEMLDFYIVVRACSEGVIDDGAARMLNLSLTHVDFMKLRLSLPVSSTCLWEAIENPPSIEGLALDAARHWGWGGAASFLKAPEIFDERPHQKATRPSLAAQLESVSWERLTRFLVEKLGPPDQGVIDQLEGSEGGARLERLIIGNESAQAMNRKDRPRPAARL